MSLPANEFRVLVLGGSGRIGTRVVQFLRARGFLAEAASRSTGVDVLSGAGLIEAVAGQDVVVDLTRPALTGLESVGDFFTTAARNMLAAEAAAGVGHHIILSIVGCDRVEPGGYLNTKFALEQEVRSGAVPFTILRATQFFEFLPAIADMATTDGRVTLPEVLLQPLAADDVALAVTTAAVADPLNDVSEVAGPECAPMVELVGRVLRHRSDPREVTSDRSATYFGTRVEQTSLVPMGRVTMSSMTLDEWLRNQPRKL